MLQSFYESLMDSWCIFDYIKNYGLISLQNFQSFATQKLKFVHISLIKQELKSLPNNIFTQIQIKVQAVKVHHTFHTFINRKNEYENILGDGKTIFLL